MEFEDWIRETSDQLRVEPEPEIWEKLENSLDQDEVWGRLGTSLDRDRDRVFWFRRLGVAAAILALFGFALWQLGIHGSQKDNAALFASETGVETTSQSGVQLHFPDAAQETGSVSFAQEVPEEAGGPMEQPVAPAEGSANNWMA